MIRYIGQAEDGRHFVLTSAGEVIAITVDEKQIDAVFPALLKKFAAPGVFTAKREARLQAMLQDEGLRRQLIKLALESLSDEYVRRKGELIHRVKR